MQRPAQSKNLVSLGTESISSMAGTRQALTTADNEASASKGSSLAPALSKTLEGTLPMGSNVYMCTRKSYPGGPGTPLLGKPYLQGWLLADIWELRFQEGFHHPTNKSDSLYLISL